MNEKKERKRGKKQKQKREQRKRNETREIDVMFVQNEGDVNEKEKKNVI